MSDITIKGWACDACEKQFFEKDSGFDAKFTITIESHTSFHNTMNIEVRDVCLDCTNRVSTILNGY